jgi:hypothetical protein
VIESSVFPQYRPIRPPRCALGHWGSVTRMRRFRLPIAGLMLFPLPFAVGLAALREPSELWASALFSLAILALLVSALGTAARRGASRMAFLGFTLFGTGAIVGRIVCTREADSAERAALRRGRAEAS